MTIEITTALIMKEKGPYKLISYGELYTVDYSNASIGTSLFASENLKTAEIYFNKLIDEKSEPIVQLKALVMDASIHRYDVWDDNDGNESYLFTDCPPEEFLELQKEFKEMVLLEVDDEEHDGYDHSEFIRYLESRAYIVVSIVRPEHDLNLNSNS